MKKSVFRQRYSVLNDGETKVFSTPVEPVAEEAEASEKENKKDKKEAKKKNGRKFTI
jgi:transcriptional regulator of NAD metabolism